MARRLRNGILALALAFAAAAFAAGPCTVLLLQPTATPEPFTSVPFMREFGREPLATSRCDRVVRRVDLLDAGQLARQVDEALASAPDLIVAPASRVALYLRARNTRTPILFVSVADPSLIGLVSDLAHPEANLTGLTYAAQEDVKPLEIAREVVGAGATVGLVVDRFFATLEDSARMIAVARGTLGLDLRVFAGDTSAEVEQAVAEHRGTRIQAWILLDTPVARGHGAALMAFLRQRGGVVVTAHSQLLSEGAHVLVQPVIESPMKTLAEMGDLLLRGISPRQIPVQRPKRFTIVLNMPAVQKVPLPGWRKLIAVVDGFVY